MTTMEFNKHLVKLDMQLKNYAYHLTANRDEALDLCQETLIKALTYRAKLTHTNLKAWIFTIMKNILINEYRRKVKQREWLRIQLDGTKNLLNASQDNPLSIQDYNDILHQINNLETSIQQPFKMFVEGFKYREIAEKLNLPIGTIKSRIFLVRKILMKNLKEFSS